VDNFVFFIISLLQLLEVITAHAIHVFQHALLVIIGHGG
jgi:hypothetical protein